MDLSQTHYSLLGLIAWSVALLAAVGGMRVGLAAMGKRAVNSFNPSGEDIPGIGYRLTRAHANCYEFLAFGGMTLLYAIATEQTEVTDGMALIFLGARLAQSITHIISTSKIGVRIRFVFFITQVVLLVFWLLRLSGLI